ncbi:enoyl-CoA hydratase/carnithine racemase [Spongiibacter sp. IMCC21906]|uniref:enoyl-CoA hydratase/isomerase family protein n=1 Tax=Spongiibacter sp. IMCC21906 TaxID=1620392 RepID=UPI00062DEF02|nr:enoyl-CoA hydratase/isomerase family protein [Spongiibacter sp. IMCC21906]AKH68249.1 enoyl-CoA hydratase/carnithine racemase [Spongiibacter sp. IMCC21906]
MANQYPTLKIEHRGQIDILTMNRPEAMNALNKQLFSDLQNYYTSLQDNYDVRLVIMRGEGRSFCVGGDLNSSAFAEGEGREVQQYETQRQASSLIRLMRSCPQPIIALCHGPVCGGGFSLALAADVRIASTCARMNAAYIKIGLSGNDMGSGYFLPRLIGLSNASLILYTGRFVKAEQALQMGLVSDVVELEQLLESGLSLADEMLQASPLGLRLTKDAINALIDAPSLESAVAIEDRQQNLLMGTADHKEAVQAFREKRRPEYKNC